MAVLAPTLALILAHIRHLTVLYSVPARSYLLPPHFIKSFRGTEYPVPAYRALLVRALKYQTTYCAGA